MSNWKQLQARISSTGGKKRQVAPGRHGHTHPQTAAAADEQTSAISALQSAAAGLASPAPTLQVEPVNVANHRTPRLALDCEMVGVGDGGKRSALARVVIVSFDERIAYATFVRPPEQVTDFRTAVSGVRPEHMAHALPFRRVQAEVAAILRDRTVIGHAVHNDLKSLMLEHPKRDLRDTATYPAYRKQQGAGSRPRRLRWLAQEFLGWEIQGDEHSPAEDAVAALRLYKLRMNEWERAVLGGRTPQAHTQTSGWERALAKGNKTKDDLRRSGAAIKKRRKIKRGTN